MFIVLDSIRLVGILMVPLGPQLLQSASPDVILESLNQMDALLTVQLFATLAGLSLATAVFFTSSVESLKGLSGEQIEKRYVNLTRHKAAIRNMEDGGRSMILAFYTFVTAIAVAFTVDGGFGEVLSGSISLEAVDVAATGLLFGLGLSLLWKGAWRIYQYYTTGLVTVDEPREPKSLT